jgi:hypothetical protein
MHSGNVASQRPDIVSFGRPPRGSRGKRQAWGKPIFNRGPEETFESLFRAHYVALVQHALELGATQDRAESMTQQAYLGLFRRRSRRAAVGLGAGTPSGDRSPGDLGRAPPKYLRRAVDRFAAPGGRPAAGEGQAAPAGRPAAQAQPPPDGRPAAEAQPATEDLDLEPDLDLDLDADLDLDLDRAWHQFLRMKETSDRSRRRALLAVAVPIAVIAAFAAAIGLNRSSSPGPISAPSPLPYPVYPQAIVASIGVSNVNSLVQQGHYLWVLRLLGTPHSAQLVRIDLRSDTVTLRRSLGADSLASIAAGDGDIWLTTGFGSRRGQLARIDPATGRTVGVLHLTVGACVYVGFTSGVLWAQCEDGPTAEGPPVTRFLRINPATGRVEWRSGLLPALNGPTAVTPDGVWYWTAAGVTGVLRAGSRARVVSVDGQGTPADLAYTSSLVYAAGFLWAFTDDEVTAKIDPASGRIVRVYSSRSYDPSDVGGLDILAVGHGALWFLDNGPLKIGAAPFSGVVRADLATGRPTGRVPAIGAASCSGRCSQIYSTPSAIWVPTSGQLIRIDPALLQAGSDVVISWPRP